MVKSRLRFGSLCVACFMIGLICLIVGSGMGGSAARAIFLTGEILMGALLPVACVYYVICGILRIE